MRDTAFLQARLSEADIARELRALSEVRWVNLSPAGTRFLPVLSSVSGDPEVGLSQEGRWAVNASAQLADLELVPVHGLPFLTRSQAEVRSELVSALKRLGLSEWIADRFPFEAIMLCAFNGGLPYWARLALTWIDDAPSTDMTLALQRLSHARWADQPTRQAALRTLSRARRNH